ncbi:BACON domain-containing protein [Dysgonomonas massiliensis]|uniref:BACON domain-containing protein n=1 Tax=Dysgonomonas massiliensis TaxID=2040292 RepID=UPI000C78244F|nr:BACON domain-containing carbohydrate-binding protein [Dysgonomonas massiliensis]
MKSYKNSIYLLFIPLLVFFITACSDDKEGQNFRIVKTTIDGNPEGLIGEIELSSADFEYKSNGDWCEIVKDGNILKLAADANYDFHNRTIEVIITSGNTEYRVPVTQTGILFEFLGDKIIQYNFSLAGGERTTELLTNINYEVVIAEEDKSWISVENLENNTHRILVKEATDRRESKVVFKYLEKTIEIKINQFDYLGYQEILGPAKMTYTNSAGERVETDIEIVEREVNKTFTLKGTFESKIPREIPLEFVDDENHRGEIRFIPAIIDPNFEDPEVNTKIKSLTCLIYANQVAGAIHGKAYGGISKTDKYFYPSTYTPVGNGNLFTFKHSSEGFPDKSIWKRDTQGIILRGTNKEGESMGYGDPYDTILHIEIFKE